ncbi:MAG: hypothetical protein A3H28_08590 [Acidobacteria bacterium RIFCSPLOWO2_02_FULL_61_28]|nr:MAG: hypothetical protein A3H28_08590 [Acidobacteria bacterium RIFCSPLOWO2_02_FULL_61_28]
METGISRATVADAAGRYRLPELPLGLYSVEAQSPGFQTEVRSGIRLTVGREAVVDMRLNVGAVTERVEVVGEAPLIQTKDSTISYLVDENTVRDLPLNGRSYTQLATLQPNVIPNANYNHHMSAGTGLNLVVQGQRPGANLFLLDGTIGNDYVGKTPGGMAGSSLGVDAIREFSLLTGNYSAEYGQYMGGVINVVTRSGTNAFHGNVFYFHRNSALDAKNFFDKLENPIPPFKRNNFGATFGGPIIRDRAFFFTNFEELVERKSLTQIARTPDANAKLGILPSGPVQINPVIRPVLDAWPAANGRLFGDGTGEYLANPLRKAEDRYGVIRTDFQISDSHSLFARYTVSDSEMGRPDTPPVFFSTEAGRNQFLTVSETAILNATTLNVLALGFNRTNGTLISEDIADFRGLKWQSDVPKIGGWTIRSPATETGPAGSRNEDNRYWYLNIYELNDKISRQQGAHSLKVGATIKQYDFFGKGNVNVGRPTFDNMREFLLGDPITFSGTLAARDAQRSVRVHLFGLFLQDDIQLRPNLTLNLGMRYEFSTSPAENNGKMAGLLNPLTDTTYTILDKWYETKKKNLAPRFGFAWDPFSNGKTSVRGGASIFHQILVPTNLELVISTTGQVPFYRGITLSRTGTDKIILPHPLSQPLTGLGIQTDTGIGYFNPQAHMPTRYFWTLGVQQGLTTNTVLGVVYSGSRAAHLIYSAGRNGAIPTTDANGVKFFPAGLSRRNPAWGGITIREYGGNGYYHAFSTNLVRRFSRGLQGQMAYTWSRNLDDGSVLFSTAEVINFGTLQDPENRRVDKGRSSFDIAHTLVGNISWDLPLGTPSGAAGKLLNGWRVSGIFSRNTGVAYTPTTGFNGRSRSNPPVSSIGTDRPNLASGRSNNPVLGGPDRYYDATAFELQPPGYYGNLGRSTISGPGFVNLDFSLRKDTPITERLNVELRAEIFNILNHPNFGSMGTGVFLSSGARQTAAGRLTDTRNDSRQIQFGMKINF